MQWEGLDPTRAAETMSEAYHLEALRKRRALERRRLWLHEREGKEKTRTKTNQLEKLPTASDAIGKSTKLVDADSYHRARLTSAHMSRRYDSTAYIMQW